eukprot:g18472.t1
MDGQKMHVLDENQLTDCLRNSREGKRIFSSFLRFPEDKREDYSFRKEADFPLGLSTVNLRAYPSFGECKGMEGEEAKRAFVTDWDPDAIPKDPAPDSTSQALWKPDMVSDDNRNPRSSYPFQTLMALSVLSFPRLRVMFCFACHTQIQEILASLLIRV